MKTQRAAGAIPTPRLVVAVGIILVLAAAGFVALSSRGTGLRGSKTIDTPSFARPKPLQPQGVPVGSQAPDFRLTDVYGRRITRGSFVSDRPGVMFFTTTYCLPCVEGLKALTRFQKDVGPDRFNVMIVFVDPRETQVDLSRYKATHDFPRTWLYALDTGNLAATYRILALDTKFVLDRSGVVRFADIFPADYGTWQQALATVGISPTNQ